MVERTVIRPSAAAKILGVTPVTVNTYLENGDLEGFKLPSGKWRVFLDSVDALTTGENEKL
jgi:predicted site-specific integrase-resolvase